MTTVLEAPVATTALPQLDEAGRALMFTAARTANSFADIPVSDEELASIWELARWAPTAANFQPLRVLYVRPGEGRDRLVAHMSEGNVAKTASAPAVAVLAVDTRFYEHIPTVLPFRPELKDIYAADADLAGSTAAMNAHMQAAYFLLAVRAQGLAAGPMAGFDHDGVDAEFFGDGRWKSVLVVNIGHPGVDPWFDRLPRLDHDEVVNWI
jgi:3-hydroxypropanoate dehydrogenase